MNPDLLEAVISVVGIALCCFLVYISVADNGIYSIRQSALITVACAVGLYLLVRFIHWAWLTPIPFISHE
jgi:hypothetical protein